MEIALACEIDMSNRSKTAADSTDVPKRQKTARERQPVIVVLLVTLFASIVVIGAMMSNRCLKSPTPRLTYQQCGSCRRCEQIGLL